MIRHAKWEGPSALSMWENAKRLIFVSILSSSAPKIPQRPSPKNVQMITSKWYFLSLIGQISYSYLYHVHETIISNDKAISLSSCIKTFLMVGFTVCCLFYFHILLISWKDTQLKAFDQFPGL